MLKTFVKVGGINNLSDARYCAGMGVDQLGFQIGENENSGITEKEFSDITGWVSGVEFVIEDYHSTLHEQLAIELVEISDLNEAEAALTSGKRVIKRISINEINSSINMDFEYILLEASLEEVYQSKDRLKRLTSEIPVVWEMIKAPEDGTSIIEIVNEFQLKGIALHGGSEIKPGLKDYDELADILEPLELD